MKHIRELRMGPPKSFKTGAVIGTYPKPLLVFQFDSGGCDIIPMSPPTKPEPNRITLDVCYADIKFIKPEELAAMCKLDPAALPKVTVIDFTQGITRLMTENFSPFAESKQYKQFNDAVNCLVRNGCPWKTFLLDSITSLVDSLMCHVSASQSSWLTDARKWSPAVGGKVLQHVAVMSNLPVHAVFIAHSHMEKNETTGDVSILPLGPNRLSEQIGQLVSQYFYATCESGKAQIWTRPKGNVKAIGCRWPSDLPQVCDADFKSIYGKELSQ